MIATNPYGAMFPPLPERETATTVHGADVTTATLSPYEEENERKRKEVLAAQEAATQKATADAMVAADVKAATERDVLKEMDARTADRAKIYEQQSGAISRATERLSEARKRFEEAPTPQLFGDRDTAGKVMLGLGMVFGALGDAQKARAAALLGQQASGPSFLTGIVQMDLQRQREKIEKLSDQTVMAQTGLKEAGEARQAALAEAELRASMAYKRVRQIGEATLASRGADKAAIDGDANLAALKAAELKERDNVGGRLTKHIANQGTDTTTTTRENKPGSEKQPTERQSTDAFLGKTLDRMLDVIDGNPSLNEATLSKVQAQELAMSAADDTAKKGLLGGWWVRLQREVTGTAPKSKTEGLSSTDQTTVSAGDIAKEMIARKLSGGAIVSDEDRQNAEKYMVHAGDSPEQKAFKLQNLRRMAADMIGLSGKAGETLSQVPAVPGAAPSAPPGEQSTAVGGAAHGTRDTRGDADAQPHESAPGPAVETPANDPDDPNSMAPLPEHPDAAELPGPTRAPTPRKLPGGVASLGKSTQGGPVAAASGKVYSAKQSEYIALVKRNPGMKQAPLMRFYGLTEEDFR